MPLKRLKRKASKSFRDAGGNKKVKIDDDDGTGATADKKPKSLLTIPAELRNRIYELALITPDEGKQSIIVTKDLKIPGLLSVSRQIRAETTKIWFLRNTFDFYIDKCDARLYQSFAKHADRHQDKDVVWHLRFSVVVAERSWPNLLEWCRMVHSGAHFLKPTARHHEYETVVRTAHIITDSHRHSSWQVCLEALEALRWMAGHMHPDWFKN